MSKLVDEYEKPRRTVKTSGGCVQGHLCRSVYGHYYYSFEGVPFAEPPVGELRFKAPVPVKPWYTLWDCTKTPEKLLQHNFLKNITEGSEGHLYANVYVKQFNTESPLPVMVFLHGGGFEIGDSTRDRHGPDYFMSQKVVLITLSYRLGPLGFLSLEDPALDCPGNAGLKDQLLGLKWVQANAKRFNGDPDSITLFGCSSGAASIHYLLMTPLAKGLFHKVILQSGSALCPWALCTLKCMHFRLAKAIGYKGDNNEADILKFLQEVDGKRLVSNFLLTKEELIDGHVFSFGPVVEPYKSSHCIIPYRPEVLIPKAWGNKIPMMIGGTSSEGLLMKERIKQRPFWIEGMEADSKMLLPNILRENFSKEKQKRLSKRIRELHFAENSISVENIMAFCEYVSYKQFWHPIHRTILSRQWYSYVPTYVYRFDFDSPFYNFYRINHCAENERGAVHCDDLCYLFHSLDSFKLEKNTPEYKNIRRMIGLWTKFAKHSNSNTKKLTNCEWMPIEKDENEPIYCLNISTDSKVIELPELNNLRVWNDLYTESFDFDDD